MQPRLLLIAGALLALQLIGTATGLMVQRRLLSAHHGFRHERPMRFRHYMRRWPVSFDSSEEADGGAVLPPLPQPAADLLFFEPVSEQGPQVSDVWESRESDESFEAASEERSAQKATVAADGAPCRPCQPAFGQRSDCPNGGFWTSENGLFKPDDNCIVCPPGTYSPSHAHYTRCLPCSKCGDDLYEEYGCTPTSDTKCDLCSTRNVHYTQSYWDKCVLMTDYGRTEDEVHHRPAAKGRDASLRKSDVASIDVSTAEPSALQREMSELRQLAENELTLPENHRLWRWKDDAAPVSLMDTAEVRQRSAEMQYVLQLRQARAQKRHLRTGSCCHLPTLLLHDPPPGAPRALLAHGARLHQRRANGDIALRLRPAAAVVGQAAERQRRVQRRRRVRRDRVREPAGRHAPAAKG